MSMLSEFCKSTTGRRATVFLVGCAALMCMSCGRAQTNSEAKPATAKNGVECLTTPNGIPRKVIVKSEHALAYEDHALDHPIERPAVE